MDWRYYEDIEVGEERKSKFLTITEKEIIDFAEKYDPQWFHSDPEESKKSSFKGLIASGIHVTAIWRLLAELKERFSCKHRCFSRMRLRTW